MSTYTFIEIHTSMYTHTYILFVYIYIEYTDTYLYTQIHICISMFVYVYIYIYIRTYSPRKIVPNKATDFSRDLLDPAVLSAPTLGSPFCRAPSLFTGPWKVENSSALELRRWL